MKFPDPEQQWQEWGYKNEDYREIGNLEMYWIRYIRTNNHWWRIYKWRS